MSLLRRCRHISAIGLLAAGGVVCFEALVPANVLLGQEPSRSDGSSDSSGRSRRRDTRGGAFKPSALLFNNQPDLKQKMGITAEQEAQFEKITMEMIAALKSVSRDKAADEADAKVLKVLTAEQTRVWEAYVAENKGQQGDDPRRDEPRRDERGRDERSRSGDSGRPDFRGGPGSSSGGPSRSESRPEPRPVRSVPEQIQQVPEGATPVASFTAKSKSDGDGPGAAGGTKGANEAGVLAFNFQYAPWADVLKLFAEAADLTLDLNDVPPGTFNYLDNNTYTVTEALDVLNGYLLPKGFILIRRDQFLVSMNYDNTPVPPSLIPSVTVDELSKRGANELLSVVIPLDGIEADRVSSEVKELLGPLGKISALKNTNSLAITDVGSNLRRVNYLLKASSAIGDPDTGFRSVPLKHITAVEAERTVRRLFGLNNTTSTGSTGFPSFGGGFPGGGFPGGGFPGGGFPGGGFPGGFSRDRGGDNRDGGSRDGGSSRGPTGPTTPSTPSKYASSIWVTADTRTNHLLITAKPSLLKVVEDVVRSIDVDESSDGKKIVASNSPAFLKAYAIVGGDVTQVSRTLNTLMPGLVVGEDSRSGKIHVHATKEEHAEIERLVQTVAGEGGNGSVAVINLMRLDPLQAANSLRNLFLNETRAPNIEPDAIGRRLLVRGTADQLSQVKVLLAQLGETSGNPLEDQVANTSTTRSIHLQGRDPDQLLKLAKQMWDVQNRNPIRIVVPSQPNPVKDRRTPGIRGRGEEANDDTGTLPRDLPMNPREIRESQGTDGRNDGLDGARPERREPKQQPSTQPERSNSRSDRPAAESGRRSSLFRVSQTNGTRETTGSQAPRALVTVSQTVVQADDQTGDSNPTTDLSKEGRQEEKDFGPQGPPIEMTIVGEEAIITCPDPKVLDQFEEMVNMLSTALPNRPRWTVFYLRTADATDTAQMLERFFPQSSVTASTSSSDGLFGSFTSSISRFGSGMMNATGINQTLGGGGNLRIITEPRSNALFITGPQNLIEEVESLLEILDSSELPETLRDRVPRTIPVEYADIDDVFDIVEDVFKDAIESGNPQQGGGGRGGQNFNPLQLLMGNAGGGGGGNRNRQQGPELSIGIDRRTSHLIVASNDSLYQRIKNLVESIDDRAKESRPTVQIMKLDVADPNLVQSTLTSLIPKVTVSATKSSGSSRRRSTDAANGGQPQQPGAPDAARDSEVIRRAMEQRMQQRGGGGGFPGGGGRGFGGGSGGGGFPGGGGRGFGSGGGGRGGR